MQAVVATKYGSPKDLQIKDIPRPVPKEGEVLVKVCATAINDFDWILSIGKPYIIRLMFGIFKPKSAILGMELAGTVEEVGPNVTSFKKGDAVYGDISDHGFGSFAEYCSINEKALTHKPPNMSFEEATSIPHASMLAFQGLEAIEKIKNNLKSEEKLEVLINGAGGGVGTFGLQLAKLHNAKVTGVDTGDKLETMKTFGFDHVVDYKKEDFTRSGAKYDLILDCKTMRSPFDYARALKPNGHFVTVGGSLLRLFQTLCLSPLFSVLTKKTLRVVSLKPNKNLDSINNLFKTEKIKCLIDGPYQFEKIPALVQYFGEGKHTGKIVISFNSN